MPPVIDGNSVLAVVPARSGSKGIPDKNMACLGGLSLIARAARTLSQISWIDRRVVSTDSPRYADEARDHGLDAPFLRPRDLSSDNAGAFETLLHALRTCEEIDRCTYQLLVVAEPTSPLRETGDIEQTVHSLLEANADAALTVSRIDSKCHPNKAFRLVDGRLQFYTPEGQTVTSRHQLQPLYARNGLCYCFRRDTLLVKQALLTDQTVPVITERLVANVDDPVDLLWAEFLLDRVYGRPGAGEKLERR
jgi:CMP-N-acetylneuraminic acid synthetase